MLTQEKLDKLIQRRADEALSRSETLTILDNEYGYSSEEALAILKDIRSREMEMDVQSSNETVLSKITNHIGFSYFFLVFALGASGYSIYILASGSNEQMNRVMPWVVLLGCLFLFIKHGQRVFKKN